MQPDHSPAHADLLLAKFAFSLLGQLTLFILLFRFVAPSAFMAEYHQPWHFVAWIFGLGLPLSLFEYLYHRYLLHSAILPFLGSMHRAHGEHHSLTSVKAPVRKDQPEELVPVTSEFSVEEEHQTESMMFPYWSLPIFVAMFGVLLALPLKLLFPTEPILLSVLGAVALYYSSYEVWHWVLHLPYEKFWKPMTEGRWTRRPFRTMYGFHVMHHWRPSCNLAIVGFWGVAVWDHAFRTHTRPQRLPFHQAQVTYEDAVLPKPLWPISQFDRWQGGMFKASRKWEKSLARTFLGKGKPNGAEPLRPETKAVVELSVNEEPEQRHSSTGHAPESLIPESAPNAG